MNQRAESDVVYTRLPKCYVKQYGRLFQGIQSQLKCVPINGDRMFCTQELKNLDSFFRIAVRRFHEITRRISTNRYREEVSRPQPFAHIRKILAITSIPYEIKLKSVAETNHESGP